MGHDHEFFTVDAPPDTDAINGRLEHLRCTALGFRDLANYIARSLLETGGFRPPNTPSIVMSRISLCQRRMNSYPLCPGGLAPARRHSQYSRGTSSPQTPPACCRHPWRLPGPGSHRQATTS